MNVFICDSNAHFHQFFSKKLELYLRRLNIVYSISCNHSIESLLGCDISLIDLLFLDIQIKGNNGLSGLDAAHILRQQNPNFTLIFISDCIEYAPFGYEVNAFRYILKEKLNWMFDSLMFAILDSSGYFHTRIALNFAFGTETVYTEDIIYVESQLHTINFYFLEKKDVRHLYDKLDNVQNLLPNHEFVRIHKSYLVNLKHLMYVKNYIAYLKNDIQLPISQLKYAETKKRFYNYRSTIQE